MTRTNIDLDDELVTAVMDRFALPTKRAAVHFALRRAAGSTASAEGLLSLEGLGWEGDREGPGDAPTSW